eukprot:8432587-Pyramimonas_sp.AAC.1
MDDDNAFREGQDARALGARAWMLSGRVSDNLFVAAVMASRTDSYATKQLCMSGSAFGHQQQHKVSRGEPRTYQAWLAHEDKDAVDILTSSYNAIFDASSWHPLQHRTEMAALDPDRLHSRLGAVAHHLVYRTNRNWPMPLL